MDDGYELGEDVTDQVRARRPVGLVVSTRLNRDLAERLIDLSEREGKQLSQLVQEAVLEYLEQRQARSRAL
jgi:predicted transcriptional regulator